MWWWSWSYNKGGSAKVAVCNDHHEVKGGSAKVPVSNDHHEVVTKEELKKLRYVMIIIKI